MNGSQVSRWDLRLLVLNRGLLPTEHGKRHMFYVGCVRNDFTYPDVERTQFFYLNHTSFLSILIPSGLASFEHVHCRRDPSYGFPGTGTNSSNTSHRRARRYHRTRCYCSMLTISFSILPPHSLRVHLIICHLV